MTDIRKIPSLKNLKLYSDEEGNGRLLLYNEVISFLGRNTSDTDQKTFYHGNTAKIFKKEGLKTVGDKKYIDLSTLIKYVFNHIHDFSICSRIASEIQAQICDKGQSSVGSIHEIYKKIAESNALDSICDDILDFEALLKQSKTSVQFNEYEKEFSAQEWKRIIVFEQQFTLAYNVETLTYDENVIKRWEFYNSLRETESIKSFIAKQSKLIIKNNSERKAASEVKHGIKIKGNLFHVPSLLDQELINQLQDEFPYDFSSFLSVGCIENICTHHGYLHVFIQLQDKHYLECPSAIMEFVKDRLSNNHLEHNIDVVFVKEDTFLKYTNERGVIQRFIFRDDYFNGTLKDQVLFRECVSENHSKEAEKCLTCSEYLEREDILDWRSLDLLNEYRTHIPVFLQIILEVFINKVSLGQAADKHKFVKSKISRLYCVYDNLLNLLNRNYTGILQELNTDELVYNYHNVGTVFQVTSHGGITSSIKTAEKRLSVQADNDLTYYNTYIKEYPLTYTSNDGQMKSHINLQSCYLILAIDNLVRMTYKDDTPRDDCRSSQICTLPITLKGIPSDSEFVASWHDTDICDGENSCPCKEHRSLSKEDLDSVLHLSSEEQTQKHKSEVLFTWENKRLWNTPEIEKLIESEVMTLADLISSDTHLDLNRSIQTLNLEEKGGVLGLVQKDEHEISMQMEGVEIPAWDISQVEGEETTVLNIETESDVSSQLSQIDGHFGFNIFSVPSLLSRHPVPAIGRDDDINKLKEILDNVLQKSGFTGNGSNTRARILFAPDHKIGANLLRLIFMNPVYKSFIPEFPLLHLRKSKITTLAVHTSKPA